MKLTRCSTTTTALLLAILVGLSGCSKLAPVTGRVLYKNEGVTAGAIYLIPDGTKGNQGSGGSSLLQLDGSFNITNPEEGRGAVGVRPGLTRPPWFSTAVVKRICKSLRMSSRHPCNSMSPRRGCAILSFSWMNPLGKMQNDGGSMFSRDALAERDPSRGPLPRSASASRLNMEPFSR